MSSDHRYKPLVSVDGEVFGYACVGCGRLREEPYQTNKVYLCLENCHEWSANAEVVKLEDEGPYTESEVACDGLYRG